MLFNICPLQKPLFVSRSTAYHAHPTPATVNRRHIHPVDDCEGFFDVDALALFVLEKNTLASMIDTIKQIIAATINEIARSLHAHIKPSLTTCPAICCTRAPA